MDKPKCTAMFNVNVSKCILMVFRFKYTTLNTFTTHILTQNGTKNDHETNIKTYKVDGISGFTLHLMQSICSMFYFFLFPLQRLYKGVSV